MSKHFVKNTGGSPIPMGAASIAPGASLLFYDDSAGRTANLSLLRQSISDLQLGLAKSFRDGTAEYRVDAGLKTPDEFYTLFNTLSIATMPSPSCTLVPLVTSPASYGSINLIVENGDSVITPGQTDYIRIPYAGQLLDWVIIADQQGSVVVDVWRRDDTALPTIANSICNASKPALTNQTLAAMSTTSWTNARFDQDDFFGFYVVSCTNVKKFRLSIKTLKQ